MKKKCPVRPPNPAAEALANAEFRQRIVKAKKNNRYSRKDKHKKREDHSNDLPVSYAYEVFCFGIATKNGSNHIFDFIKI